MAFIDVLKYDGPNNVLVWKWRPKNDGKRQEELRLGTQLIVNQSQQAVFVEDGQIADVFETGSHTLTAANLPILTNIIGLAFGGQSPFKAEVYFINKAISMDTKFGLIPFNMIEPNFRVPIPITSRGSFAVKIADARIFLNKILGTVPDFEADKLKHYFRGVITENVKTAITKIAREQKISPLELEAIVVDISEAVKGIISNTFAQYGIHLELFNIEGIPIIDEDERVKKIVEDYQRLMSQDMEERMRLKRRAENLDMYKIERSFDTTEAAAGGIGGGDGILGTMVGLGMVQPLGNAIGGMMNNITPNVQQSIATSKDEIIKLLKELGELKAAGILTEEEFAEKKKELLSKI
ncbi:MAG: SPFH domain-containing protein [Prevotellaceae bacterium]|jgi:membrane protease subunit (stomatin/prohibitin family)|nr:SPFH domain-containing protein [Prevotellaceae bacterium]